MFLVNNPICRKSNIVVQNLKDELLIYDLKINKAYCLNETSALAWQLSDGTNSVSKISNLMSRKLKILVSEDLVWLALNELRKDDLLENGEEFSNHFGGLTRREVIRKVGFASMVVLPIISSLVAPSAAMAQSGCLADHAPCTPGGNCCSGACQVNTSPTNFACCVPTGTFNLTPGTPFCHPTDCSLLAGIVCCSGSASLVAPNPTACTDPNLTCVCDPHP